MNSICKLILFTLCIASVAHAVNVDKQNNLGFLGIREDGAAANAAADAGLTLENTVVISAKEDSNLQAVSRAEAINAFKEGVVSQLRQAFGEIHRDVENSKGAINTEIEAEINANTENVVELKKDLSKSLSGWAIQASRNVDDIFASLQSEVQNTISNVDNAKVIAVAQNRLDVSRPGSVSIANQDDAKVYAQAQGQAKAKVANAQAKAVANIKAIEGRGQQNIQDAFNGFEAEVRQQRGNLQNDVERFFEGVGDDLHRYEDELVTDINAEIQSFTSDLEASAAEEANLRAEAKADAEVGLQTIGESLDASVTSTASRLNAILGSAGATIAKMIDRFESDFSDLITGYQQALEAAEASARKSIQQAWDRSSQDLTIAIATAAKTAVQVYGDSATKIGTQANNSYQAQLRAEGKVDAQLE